MPPATANVTVVRLTTTEYHLSYARPVASGRVVVMARNAGSRPHEVVLARLAETPSPDNAPTKAGAQGQVVHPLGYVPARRPGARGAFAVDLVPGRYLLACFVRDPDGVGHDAKGMRSTFVVR